MAAADAGVDGVIVADLPPEEADPLASSTVARVRLIARRSPGRLADGVIVGSALVRFVEERAGSPALAADVERFVADLKHPLRRLPGGSGGGRPPQDDQAPQTRKQPGGSGGGRPPQDE